MSKNCKECEYFGSYDYSDGTPICDIEGGYQYCPFNEGANVKKNGITLEVDTGFVSDYIRHTIMNSINSNIHQLVETEVKKLVNETIKEEAIEMTRFCLKDTVQNEVKNYMQKDIVIGGGWREPEQIKTRNEFLAETVEKELKSKTDKDSLIQIATSLVKKEMDNFFTKTRNEINANIKKEFDNATRQCLTDNVVSMLMTNDTYQRLNQSMQTFLP